MFREEIYWNGELVGYAREVRQLVATLYGKWVPAPTDAADHFLAEVTELTDEQGTLMGEVWVGLGNNNPLFVLVSISTDDIALVYSPNPSDSIVQ